MLSRDMEDIENTEIECIEMKTTMSEVKTPIRTSDAKTMFLPLPPQYSSLDPEFDLSSPKRNTALILKVLSECSP